MAWSFLNWFFCNHTLPVFPTVFLQSRHISGCSHTVTDFAITRIFTRLQPHQANTNLVAIWQCHGMELFWTGFLQSHFDLFLQSQSHAVFATFFCNHTAIRSQSHWDKVVITHMRQGCNHAHAGFCNCFFAIATHQWLQPRCNFFLQSPVFSPGCNHIKQTLT
jgi:hypothetical protein